MRKSHWARPWILVSAAWIAPALLNVINQLAQQRIWNGPPVTTGALLYASGDWLLYAILTPAVFALSAHWPLERATVGRHAALHLCLSLVFCAAWATAGTGLRALVQPETIPRGFARDALGSFFWTLPFGVAVYLAVVGAEHAFRHVMESAERRVQIARLSQQLSSAQLEALQAQVNPHFLFNTLNTLAVLVREGDRATAGRLIEQLSDVLRRTLAPNRTDKSTLDDELALVKQYLAIEQARFSDRLRATFEIDESAARAAVPSFAVQQLVENAVRHGIAKRLAATSVVVKATVQGDMIEICVIDDGPGVDETATMVPGHGLENTRNRLQVVYGERASLKVTRLPNVGTIATLRLPYLIVPKPDDEPS